MVDKYVQNKLTEKDYLDKVAKYVESGASGKRSPEQLKPWLAVIGQFITEYS